MNFSTFTFLVVVSVVVNYSNAQRPRISYGEACSKVLRCDSKASLTCDEGLCQCVMPEKMVYDSSKAKCVTMAGEKCVYTAVEMADDTSETETTRWREELDCVSNALCTAGYCACGEGYFENFNGTCEEKHGYGEICEMNSHCKENLHLVCNTNGTCDCNGLTSYDEKNRKCVGRVGSLCMHYPECVENAKCPAKQTREESSYGYDPSYGYSRHHTKYITVEYSSEVCECKSGYANTGDGNCLASFGSSCDYHVSSKRCLPGMMCREGICSCKYEGLQTYDHSTSRCQSLIGAPCSATEATCGQNAECLVDNKFNQPIIDYRKDQQSKQCRCSKGFIEVNRGCEIEYGQKCGPSIYGNAKCDSIAPLKCIEGHCQCNSLEYYDEEMKLCRGLEGAFCSTDMKSSYFCTDGATCDSYRNKEQGMGLCTCKINYDSTSTRKCILKTLDEVLQNEIEIETTTTPAPSSIPILSALLDSRTTSDQ